MTTRKIDHKQLKARGANTGDILQVAGADDLNYVDPNTVVVSALTGGTGITIEANGLVIGTAGFSGNTDTIPESTSNLYFTNVRAVAAIEGEDELIVGNLIPKAPDVINLGNSTHRWGIVYVSAGTISLGNLYLKEGPSGKMVITTDPANTESDSGLVDLTTDDILEGSNLYYTNVRAIAAVVDSSALTDRIDSHINDFITTSNVQEGANLYFTNARAVAAVQDNINTSNVIEGSNLYYTNARVEAYISDSITTSNITEGDNLYFTNTRSVSSLTGGTGITIDANGLITSSGAASTFSGTTDGIVEGTANLYFTNTRAVSALTGGDNITIEANGLIIGQPGYSDADAYANIAPLLAALTTDDVTEGTNLYYTNARVEAYISDSITTSNVTEGDNLYFTNTRSVGSLTGGIGIAIDANGLITATGNANPVFTTLETGDLTVTGNLVITGNATTIQANILQIDDPLIHLAANNETSDAVDIGFISHYSPDAGTTKQHAGIFRKHNTENFYVFAEYVDDELDSGNLVTNIDTSNNTFKLATVHANVFTGNVTGTVTGTVSSLANHDTDDLIEGTSNLYFTNTRAVGSLTGGSGIVINANGLVQSTGEAGTFTGTTDGIAEGTSNLYYTNARVDAYINDSITTTDITEGDNLYFTNARAIAAVQDNISTSNVTEGANLYFTNTRAIGSLTAGAGIVINANGLVQSTGEAATFTGTTDGVVEGSANLYFTNARAIAAVQDNINTSNVIEGSNLYFTNTRAVSALTGGTGITIDANGLITGSSTLNDTDDLPEGTANLYFTNTRAVSALTGGTGITIDANGLITGSSTLTDTDDLPEGSANLYFTNARVVGAFTAGNSIVLESNGYIDVDAAYLTYASSQTFTGNGVQQVFTMNNSVADPDTLIVSINGVVKVPTTDYTVSGNQLTFISAPANSSTIEVRYLNITTSTVLEYYTRTYQGNGVQTVFSVSSGLASNALLVFENGVAQVPYVDYSIIGANIVFGTAPGANTIVQIRELPKLNVIERIAGNTDVVTEVAGTANLYFTNARVYAALTGGTGVVIEANGLIVGQEGIDSQNGTLGNLIVTGNLSTPEATITELTVTGNLSVTGNLTTISAQSLEITDPLIKLAANNETSDAVDIGWVGHYSPDAGTTRQHAGVFRDADDGHFYVFSEYVDDDLEVANTVTNIDRTNNTFKLGTVHANIFVGNVTGTATTVSSLANHDTDDLVESSSNLYFSNTRAIAAFTAGANINIESNGYISADNAITALVLSGVQALEGNGVTQQYLLTSNVTSNDSIIVNVDGLMARPTIDYGVASNTILTFTSAPVNGANIEVRYLSYVYATPESSNSIIRRAMVTAILFG